MDNELILFDRINVIKDLNSKYDLEKNAYISFSGGKDSTVLHYLIDMALPNNNIPRVFSDTGIEYRAIRKFVHDIAEKDNRFEIIKPNKPIKKMLEEVGYPFKSKEHSEHVRMYQSSGMGKSVRKYLDLEESTKQIKCPIKLKYQFTPEFNIKISPHCCNELKKKPFAEYSKQTGRKITITGMQKSEGGQRLKITCIVTDKNNKVVKFHPLAVVNDEWEQWFIDTYNIRLCELYYPPYNFKRTGCVGCPYNLKLQKQLDTMEHSGLISELKQANILWKPVYDEYRRIGYRLRKEINYDNLLEELLKE